MVLSRHGDARRADRATSNTGGGGEIIERVHHHHPERANGQNLQEGLCPGSDQGQISLVFQNDF